MNAISPTSQTSAISAVLQHNDLSKLTAVQKNDYYMGVCSSLGMNPMTRPFEFIRLGGREVLYAKRDAADQLRKINSISIEVVSREVKDDMLTVHVRAKEPSGRIDEDFGVVSIAGLKGENLANAILKGVTKAKRRVTLSISGLGFLDETEVADIPNAKPVVVESVKHPEPVKVDPPVHPETGEVSPHRIALMVRADGASTDWVSFGQSYSAALNAAQTKEEFEEWIGHNAPAMNTIATDAPKFHGRLCAIIEARRLALSTLPKGEPVEQAHGEAT